jgi:hypothetical protein
VVTQVEKKFKGIIVSGDVSFEVHMGHGLVLLSQPSLKSFLDSPLILQMKYYDICPSGLVR